MDDVEVTKAVCALLAAAAVGVWRPTGPVYTTAEVGIHYGPISSGGDRGVGVAMYMTDDTVDVGTATRLVQVRYRGAMSAPAGADTLADAGFAALHDTYPGGGIARIARTSSARLGADENGRQERTDNYQIILDNPEATP